MRLIDLSLVLSLAAAGTGCGDGNPAGPSPAAANLAISGSGTLLTGDSAQFRAIVTAADGTPATVSPSWTSSNPTVGIVNATGAFTARSHGTTTLTASYLGQNATTTVRVVNDYGGTWEVMAVVTSCVDTGDLVDHDGGWCRSGPGHIGLPQPLVLRLIQSTADPTLVEWLFDDGRVRGSVTADGRLTLAGTIDLWDWYHEVVLARLQIDSWDTSLVDDSMSGGWSQTLSSLTFRIGTASTTHEISTARRVSRTTAVLQP